LASLTGSIAGIGKKLKDGELSLEGRLPFGIFLGIGSVMALLVGQQLVAWYVRNFIP
jgi:prepilin signal peptidase PulO-like enzyme (type II secretory pathway)